MPGPKRDETPARDPKIRKGPLEDPPNHEPPRGDPPQGPPRRDPPVHPDEPVQPTKIEDPSR